MSRIGKAVTLRKRQRSGVTALYLTIRKDGIRRDEYLNLYLYPETDRVTRARNNETMREAERICAQRLLEVEQGAYNTDAPKATLRTLIKSTPHQFASAVLTDLDALSLADVPLNRLTTAHLMSLRQRWQSRLTDTSAQAYEGYLRKITKVATMSGLMRCDLFKQIAPLTRDTEPRAYLTEDELKTLCATKCHNDHVRRLFLFACLTGLRWSDLKQLKWEDIKQDGSIVVRQVKTKAIVTTYMTQECWALVGDRQSNDAPVFEHIPSNPTCNRVVERWAAMAHIDKYVTFHTSRHTFATLLVSRGTDVYIVSKLLGHASVATTQIYAEVLDDAKKAAVNNLPKLDI